MRRSIRSAQQPAWLVLLCASLLLLAGPAKATSERPRWQITVDRAAAAGPQVERGAEVFRTVCSKCHGAQGQGGDGPRLIGAPNGLAEYQMVPKLYAFIKGSMPGDNPNSLSDEAYWDALAFILDGNGLLPPDVT